METKAFDKIVHFFLDELNYSMLYTPGFFYSVGWFSRAKPVFDLQPYSPEYTKAWKDAYGMFIDHITEKGWRKNFVLYLSDEPRIPLAYNAIARVADMAKEVAPDVPIYVSNQTDRRNRTGNPDLLTRIDNIPVTIRISDRMLYLFSTPLLNESVPSVFPRVNSPPC